jgi:hypothetical protein
MSCDNLKTNMSKCNCTYSGCDNHGKCCECLSYHLSMKQLPACAFPKDVEATYDRSFKAFVKVCKDRYGIVA